MQIHGCGRACYTLKLAQTPEVHAERSICTNKCPKHKIFRVVSFRPCPAAPHALSRCARAPPDNCFVFPSVITLMMHFGFAVSRRVSCFLVRPTAVTTSFQRARAWWALPRNSTRPRPTKATARRRETPGEYPRASKLSGTVERSGVRKREGGGCVRASDGVRGFINPMCVVTLCICSFQASLVLHGTGHKTCRLPESLRDPCLPCLLATQSNTPRSTFTAMLLCRPAQTRAVKRTSPTFVCSHGHSDVLQLQS